MEFRELCVYAGGILLLVAFFIGLFVRISHELKFPFFSGLFKDLTPFNLKLIKIAGILAHAGLLLISMGLMVF